MKAKIKGPPIFADVSKCSGCLICQLRCSLRFEKEINPAKSAIRIRRLAGEKNEYDIFFTERCDNCGICARHCPYGALVQKKIQET